MKDYNNFNSNETNDEETEAKEHRFKFFKKRHEDGPGVDKDEIRAMENPTLVNFFKLLARKIGRLMTINAIYIFGNFPILFLLLHYTQYNEFSANTYSLFPALYGTSLFDRSPTVSTLLGIFGRVSGGYAQTFWSVLFLCLFGLIIFTFGPVNIGTTYILRNMAREEPVFMLQDFFHAIKKNLRQGIIMGIIDVFMIGMLVYDILFFNVNMGRGNMITPMLIITWAMVILYFFMRLYIYLMIVTFDLSLFKIIKNALFFAILGFKRNFMALLGCVAMLFITYELMVIILPLGIAIPLFFIFGLGGFMGVYAAYPKIKEIMIDPYYKDHPDEEISA